MTIKPFLNKMSADLASALGGGKKVSTGASLDSKSADNTGDVSFKNALTQALEPKSSAKAQKNDAPKAEQGFATAPKAAPAKSEKSALVQPSESKADGQADALNPDALSHDKLEAASELIADQMVTMMAQAPILKPETPELGLNLLSLAQAQALAENPQPTDDAQMEAKPAALHSKIDLAPALPHYVSAMLQGAAAHDALDAEQALKQKDSATSEKADDADSKALIQASVSTTPDAVNPSLIALMAATPSFPAMPAAAPVLEEKRSSQKASAGKVNSDETQKGFQPELAQSSFLPLLPLNAQTFGSSLQSAQETSTQSEAAVPPVAQDDAASSSDGNAISETPHALRDATESVLTPANAFSADAKNDFSSLSLSFMPAPEANALAQAETSDLSKMAQNALQGQATDVSMPPIDATIANTLQLQGQFLNASQASNSDQSKAAKGSGSVEPKKTQSISSKQTTQPGSVSSQQVTISKSKSANMNSLGQKSSPIEANPIEESKTQETSSNTMQKSGFEHLLSQADFSVQTVAASGADNNGKTDSNLPVFVSHEVSPGDQVMEATAYAAKHGQRELIIKLNPDNLGAVKINLISHSQGGLTAKLIASSADSASLLSQQAESLQASLEAKGVKIEKISVIVAGQGEFSAIAASSETHKSQSQNSNHDHNPTPQNQQQSQTSQQQNFHQEQQNQQMAQAFQQQMNQSHRQSYWSQPQSNSPSTGATAAGGIEIENDIEAAAPVKNQNPGEISVLA